MVRWPFVSCPKLLKKYYDNVFIVQGVGSADIRRLDDGAGASLRPQLRRSGERGRARHDTAETETTHRRLNHALRAGELRMSFYLYQLMTVLLHSHLSQSNVYFVKHK